MHCYCCQHTSKTTTSKSYWISPDVGNATKQYKMEERNISFYPIQTGFQQNTTICNRMNLR